VISRAALKVVSRGAARTDIVSLPAELLDLDGPALPGVTAPRPPDEAIPATLMPLRDAVDATQRRLVRAALDACGGNWADAARRLDVDPSNLHKLARRLGLK
jgi:anaerobic nitric oxide reductase transcription regulator